MTITILTSGTISSSILMPQPCQQLIRNQLGALIEKALEMIYYQDRDVNMTDNVDPIDVFMK